MQNILKDIDFTVLYPPKIVEGKNAKFLEGNESSGDGFPRTIEFKEIKEPVGKA